MIVKTTRVGRTRWVVSGGGGRKGGKGVGREEGGRGLNQIGGVPTTTSGVPIAIGQD